ncbi:MAG: hypothetical protein KDD37_08360 [Bdellovibrionales bacterium]|nr:hypothetical protein [Bdellovibrionales bacterium]
MKFFLSLMILCSFTGNLYASNFWRGSTLSKKEVLAKWGKTEFDIERFKNSKLKPRAEMAFSLLSQKSKYIGKNVTDIFKLFGPKDGYYFSDYYPAYMLSRGKTNKDESWQLVFLLDKNQKISDIIVHQNCCE